jgi:hypothetical protein
MKIWCVLTIGARKASGGGISCILTNSRYQSGERTLEIRKVRQTQHQYSYLVIKRVRFVKTWEKNTLGRGWKIRFAQNLTKSEFHALLFLC